MNSFFIVYADIIVHFCDLSIQKANSLSLDFVINSIIYEYFSFKRHIYTRRAIEF